MARYKRNAPSQQLASLLKSPRLSAVTMAKGRSIAMKYKALAPVESGELKASVRTRMAVGGKKKDRYVSKVTVSAPHAAAQEFGYRTKKGRVVPGGHYLRRASGLGG